MRIVPSSSMSTSTSYSDSRPRIVSPPLPVTGPINLGLILFAVRRGHALARAGALEVHVAEVVLRTLDVREDDVVVALLHEAHRDARHRRLDRHARVHQRERRPADRAHRRRAVRLERLRDEADRVRELARGRDHRLERALREGAVTDVATLRAAHEAGL